MQIEIHLKKLFAEIGKDEQGILKELAGAIDVNRHTIEDLYHNRVKNPSLSTLGKLCDWLQEKGISAKRLPHDLFGRAPQHL